MTAQSVFGKFGKKGKLFETEKVFSMGEEDPLYISCLTASTNRIVYIYIYIYV